MEKLLSDQWPRSSRPTFYCYVNGEKRISFWIRLFDSMHSPNWTIIIIIFNFHEIFITIIYSRVGQSIWIINNAWMFINILIIAMPIRYITIQTMISVMFIVHFPRINWLQFLFEIFWRSQFDEFSDIQRKTLQTTVLIHWFTFFPETIEINQYFSSINFHSFWW